MRTCSGTAVTNVNFTISLSSFELRGNHKHQPNHELAEKKRTMNEMKDVVAKLKAAPRVVTNIVMREAEIARVTSIKIESFLQKLEKFSF